MTSSYGAIATTHKSVDDAEDPAENSFEEYNVDYVQQRKLTSKERFQKILAVGVPIVIALIIVGGFGWWSSKAVAPRHDYTKVSTQVPAPQHSIQLLDDEPKKSATSSTVVYPSPSPAPKKKTATSASKTASSSSGSASCSANPKCKALDLTGECCPTGDGTNLGCCN
jgi:hypothetical protein